MDENGEMMREPISQAELCQFAESYQRTYFPQFDPQVTIAINTHPDFLRSAAFDPITKVIHISKVITPFHEISKIALLHEMIHVNLLEENGDADRKHGARFKAEVRRLRERGAYDLLL